MSAGPRTSTRIKLLSGCCPAAVLINFKALTSSKEIAIFSPPTFQMRVYIIWRDVLVDMQLNIQNCILMLIMFSCNS